MIVKEALSQQLDRLTRLAARALGVPMVAVSVIGHDRVFYFARVGFAARESLRQGSLCYRVVQTSESLHIVDIESDPGLAHSAEAHIALGARMYAGYPLRWPSGKPLGALCVMDHTPRSLSKEDLALLADLAGLVEGAFSTDELRRQAELGVLAEEHLRALLQAVPDLVFRLTSEGVFIDYHCSSPDLLFMLPSSFLGRSIREVLPTEVSSAFTQSLANAVARDSVERFEYDLSLDGRERRFMAFVRWLSGEFTVVIRDITEERQLAQERNRLARIVEEIQDPCCLTDLTGRVLYLNPYGRELLGIPSGEMIESAGLHLADFQLPHSEGADSAMDATVRDGSFSGETILVTRQGEHIPVSVRSVVHRGPDGAPEGISTVMRDIRAAKLHERALERAADAAQAANRAKSSFLANMSHELRTPLNGVIGFAELLADQSIAPLTPEQSEFVQHIMDSGRHLLRLVSDILDISKVEAGRIAMSKEPVSLGALARTILAELQPLADSSRITLSAELAPDVPAVRGDPGRIKQILYNLLSNAIKFTRPGGRVSLSLQREEDTAVIHVADTGIGIRTEDLSRLFREFEQIESHTGTKPEGTGLGLALSKRLAELHGGSISVESEFGKGSTFTVRLPTQTTDAIALENSSKG